MSLVWNCIRPIILLLRLTSCLCFDFFRLTAFFYLLWVHSCHFSIKVLLERASDASRRLIVVKNVWTRFRECVEFALNIFPMPSMPHDDPITSGNKIEWCRWTWVLALHLYPARAPLSLHANNLCKSTSLYKWCFFIAILLFWRSSSSRVTQILWADVMFKYYVYIIIMSVYLIWCWCCNLIAINLTSSVLANVV